ncbi:MAG: hypothetical protein NVSMB42_12480 [Herpetosiphon sp.]
MDVAIAVWTPLARHTPQAAAFLAEAYFRRALSQGIRHDAQADLRQACTLAPTDLRYRYHLGLALHHGGDVQGAIVQYRSVLEQQLDWPGAALVLVLALLELDPQMNLATVPESTAAIRATLLPVQMVLHGAIPPQHGDAPFDRLWRGLGLVQHKDPAAVMVLDDRRPLATAEGTAVRRYYKGVAAAQVQDLDGALQAWRNVTDAHFPRPWLRDNLAAVVSHHITSLVAEGQEQRASVLALGSVALAVGNLALGEVLIPVLDHAAHQAAHAGDWATAISLWEGVRLVMSGTSGLGSPRPVWQNLALAYERQEQWMPAAAAWRGMLRSRPRKVTAREVAPGEMTDAQWAWVRRRVIECYKRAGAPGEAVALFRQAVKAEPNDLETRLQLVDALLANDQEQAALNEVQRILTIDPGHVDAQMRMASLHAARGELGAALQVARSLFQQHPERDDLRSFLVLLLLEQGSEFHSWRDYGAATKLFAEGQELAPDNYQFPLNLARVLLDQRKIKEARPLLDRTLELAADQPQAYIFVIDCWAVANQEDEARRVLARAEAAIPLTADIYLGLGMSILGRTVPQRGMMLFGRPSQPAPPTDTPLSRLARELLDKALALRPDDPAFYQSVAASLMLKRADWAIEYAERAVALGPNRPDGLITLGLVLGLNQRVKEAKDILRRAVRLARVQGNAETARYAEELIREVGKPMLRMSMEMAAMADDLDMDIDLPDHLF